MERLILRDTGGAGSGAMPSGPTGTGRLAMPCLEREREVEATLKLLGRTSIRTLTGQGGVGETRLALEMLTLVEYELRTTSVT
ncbi:hypothetical protein ACM01_06620 [Streptomyces viridochromogenes]|uniref:Uncharacterized protein n=1 Tax=Streptomyces viridochromogenes TaxID=1938 RepID=A0A0J7ZJ30_STRVR|nr:hypothetical protein [Streptomyces viridochromogenes]KMS75904.1 hypothetical protein ACM01_06620 [Streptomyces viridochromogenes]KOG07484.1 hypothetical protein ADK35_42630 [Streptomyces viridochromogenes]KOG12625.1 hypothetical protein ADK36_33650 [Streptomyces viridochromogenes]